MVTPAALTDQSSLVGEAHIVAISLWEFVRILSDYFIWKMLEKAGSKKHLWI